MSDDQPRLRPMMRPKSDATVVYDVDDQETDVQKAPEAVVQREGYTPLGLPVAFGRYKVISQLGEGGMGVVYKAHGRGDGDVAVKVMSEKHAAKPHLVKRFLREFKICHMLEHPNIARGLSWGRTDTQPYFVLEFVQGPSVDDLIEAGKMRLEDTLDLIRQTCVALSFAHESGVVHRDIKPANVLVREDGKIAIIDFGIAGLVDEEDEELEDDNPRKKLMMTEDNCVMGTPYYMSPEQSRSLKDADHRTDIYAIGICLYEMISGRTASGLLSPDAVPEGLGNIIGRATAYNRDKRYNSMKELIADLDRYRADGGIEKEKKALSEIEDGAKFRETMMRMLFPREVPEIPGMDLAAMYLPAAGVGGNYYDFVDVDGTAVGLLVGNLGQRPNAESMVFLAMVRSAFRLCARNERDPAVALALTNDFIAREQMDCFAVFSYAIIDPEERTLRVATAGFRPSGILRRGSDHFEVVETPGLGLGIIEGADYDSVKTDLQTNDVVVFTSMGVVKTTNREGEAFGQERLDSLITLNRDGTAQEIVDAVKKRILRYSGGVAQADDMTLCVLKVG
jgi:serine phosphatase RsbU (regulator of sigma subunit)